MIKVAGFLHNAADRNYAYEMQEALDSMKVFVGRDMKAQKEKTQYAVKRMAEMEKAQKKIESIFSKVKTSYAKLQTYNKEIVAVIKKMEKYLDSEHSQIRYTTDKTSNGYKISLSHNNPDPEAFDMLSKGNEAVNVISSKRAIELRYSTKYMETHADVGDVAKIQDIIGLFES